MIDWVKTYEAEGGEAFLPHDRNRVYSAEQKIEAVKAYLSGEGSMRETTQKERIQIARECIAEGKNYGAMVLKYKVSYQQVRSWTLRYEELGDAGLEDRRDQRKKSQTPRSEIEQAQIENEQLKHRLYLAEMELALPLLKKWRGWKGGMSLRSNAGTSLPSDRTMPQGPIEPGCKLLHVARSAYHK